MALSYRLLLKLLQSLNAEQLRQDVTVNIDGEFYPLHKLVFAAETDVLDAGHPFLESETFEMTRRITDTEMTRRITNAEFNRRYAIATNSGLEEYAFIKANFFVDGNGNGEGAFVLINHRAKDSTHGDVFYGHLCNNLVDIHDRASQREPMGTIGDVVTLTTRGIYRPIARVIEHGFLEEAEEQEYQGGR